MFFKGFWDQIGLDLSAESRVPKRIKILKNESAENAFPDDYRGYIFSARVSALQFWHLDLDPTKSLKNIDKNFEKWNHFSVIIWFFGMPCIQMVDFLQGT